MALANTVVSISTTRTAITVPATAAAWIKNNGGHPVFLGSSTVTADSSATGGLVLEPGEKIGPFAVGGTLYGVVAAEYGETPTSQVSVLSGL
jgi:hypothetical protein